MIAFIHMLHILRFVMSGGIIGSVAKSVVESVGPLLHYGGTGSVGANTGVVVPKGGPDPITGL